MYFSFFIIFIIVFNTFTDTSVAVILEEMWYVTMYIIVHIRLLVKDATNELGSQILYCTSMKLVYLCHSANISILYSVTPRHMW